jgi:hypothetical protein
MLLNNIVIPGVSLGGIRIGDKVDNAIDELGLSCVVQAPNNFVIINEGILYIGYDIDRLITCVGCSSICGINYKNKLWPGMSVQDVLERSKIQKAECGCVIIDNIDGIGLVLPNEFDDFDEITDFLPLNYVFETLSIFKPLWPIKRRLSRKQ